MDGQWKILHTGYERLWECSEVLPENTLTFKSMFDEAELERRGKRVRRDGEPPLVFRETRAKE